MNTRIFYFIFIFSILNCTSVFAQKQVTHLVLFKLKEGVSKEDEQYKNAILLAKTLPVKIKEIEDCSMGENFSTRPIAFDFGLTVIFASRKNLSAYLAHPAHLELVEAWKKISDWNVVDYEELEE